MRFVTLTLAVATLASCGKPADHTADAASHKAAVPADTGMPMHGMPARATSGTMAEQMRTHLQAMTAMNADSMRARLPMHVQMAGDMMAQMTREMADMKMTPSPAWTALMDSVHQDLARMPAMTGTALEKTMAEHHARLTRLMELRRGMMGPASVPP